jgi:hypothetical protein
VRSSAAPTPTSAPTPTLSSKIASLFGNFNFMGTSANAAPDSYTPQTSKIASLFGNFNFMGTSANAAPERSAPPISPPQIGPPNPPPKHEGDSANAKKTDSTIQGAQGSIGKGHEAKQGAKVAIQQEDRALFEEFLRWREREKIFNTLGPSALTRK